MAARCLDTLGADAAKIRTQVIRMVGESQEAVAAGPAGGQGSNKTPTLEEYGTNLTAQAESVRTPILLARHMPVTKYYLKKITGAAMKASSQTL